MKLLVEQARCGIFAVLTLSGKLSALYSSGLADKRGGTGSWKRGKRFSNRRAAAGSDAETAHTGSGRALSVRDAESWDDV